MPTASTPRCGENWTTHWSCWSAPSARRTGWAKRSTLGTARVGRRRTTHLTHFVKRHPSSCRPRRGAQPRHNRTCKRSMSSVRRRTSCSTPRPRTNSGSRPREYSSPTTGRSCRRSGWAKARSIQWSPRWWRPPRHNCDATRVRRRYRASRRRRISSYRTRTRGWKLWPSRSPAVTARRTAGWSR